jgi:hypothetical protein
LLIKVIIIESFWYICIEWERRLKERRWKDGDIEEEKRELQSKAFRVSEQQWSKREAAISWSKEGSEDWELDMERHNIKEEVDNYQ